MEYVAFILFSGLLHRLRGWSPDRATAMQIEMLAEKLTSKAPIALYYGMATAGFLAFSEIPALIGWTHVALISAVVSLGYLLAVTPGWGKGFSALGNLPYMYHEKEWPPANQVGDLYYRANGSDVGAGVAYMTARSVWFAPLFASLAYFAGWWTLCGLLMLALGGCYWLAGKIVAPDWRGCVAEIVTGLVLGVALAGVFYGIGKYI